MSKIYQYIWISGGTGGTYIVPHTFFVHLKKREKVHEYDLYLNQILYHFDLKIFFLGWIIKKLQKWGPAPISYEVSIVVEIDFIAILLTPGIFLIQIFDTNVYFNQFHGKNNIQMRFPKSLVFKVSNQSHHSLSISTQWNK